MLKFNIDLIFAINDKTGLGAAVGRQYAESPSCPYTPATEVIPSSVPAPGPVKTGEDCISKGIQH